MGLLYYHRAPAPMNPLRIEFNEQGVTSLNFRTSTDEQTEGGDPFSLEEKLDKYFAGNQYILDSIPLDFAQQGTPFQRSVWQALRTIPFGHALTYGDIAKHIGNKGAVRAVGNANGKNPIPLIIPCHRVIASQKRIGGFSSGLDIKTVLLRHEKIEVVELIQEELAL